MFTVSQSCPECNGYGEIAIRPCIHCNGNGYKPLDITINVDISKFIHTGNKDSRKECATDRIIVRGYGNCGFRGAPYGDLHVIPQN